MSLLSFRTLYQGGGIIVDLDGAYDRAPDGRVLWERAHPVNKEEIWRYQRAKEVGLRVQVPKPVWKPMDGIYTIGENLGFESKFGVPVSLDAPKDRFELLVKGIIENLAFFKYPGSKKVVASSSSHPADCQCENCPVEVTYSPTEWEEVETWGPKDYWAFPYHLWKNPNERRIIRAQTPDGEFQGEAKVAGSNGCGTLFTVKDAEYWGIKIPQHVKEYLEVLEKTSDARRKAWRKLEAATERAKLAKELGLSED